MSDKPAAVGAVPAIDFRRVEAVARCLGVEARLLRQFRTQLYKKYVSTPEALAVLPAAVRDAFTDAVDLHPLQLEGRFDSQLDGATKLVFRTRGERRIEAVLLRATTGRVSLCLSTQAGCGAACDFCATGKMGLLAQLTAGEIFDQVVQAGQQLAPEGRTIRNLVLMGMGEPLHNEAHVLAALDALRSGPLTHHAPQRMLVSTVGVPDGMLRLAQRLPEVNQALSLHSVRQEVRERLIPLARRASVTELRDTIVTLNRMQTRSVMLEYLLLAGVNDSLADAHELVNFATGLRVHVNLIPYNPIESAPHLQGSDRATREAFGQVVKQAGIPCTMRYSMGADIEAACGQLVQQMDRTRRGRSPV